MSALYQYSHAFIFEQKKYDGHYPAGNLKKHGNIGLGTFNGLNGELVMLEGECYQCIPKKPVKIAADDVLIPWGVVTAFTDNASKTTLENITHFSQLESKLSELTDMHNAPYVFHIQAEFNHLLLRQVIKQEKPYILSLEEVYAESPPENIGPITADLVGFYIPEFMQGLQPKGLHFHGVTTDKQSGGHLADLSFKTATLTFEKITDIKVTL